MKKFPTAPSLAICLLLSAITRPCRGYVLEDLAWPAGSRVVMRLGLSATTVSLQDGSGSWNNSAADALAIWNDYLDFIHVSSVASATVPQQSGDGANSVFFSGTVFGDSFGEGTLAVTVFLGAESQAEVMAEADVVVNSAYRYNSYRGAEQSGVYDFHRIILHEFGHVLGLGHDTTYPSGTKIMEPVISDWDHLGADDVAGIRNLYGADFYYPTVTQTLRIGYQFIYDLPTNNSPTSYSANVLPPGIVLEPTTGRIIGTPTKSGVYNTVVTSHGPIADAYTPFQMTVLGVEEVPGLLSILVPGASSLVADPIRPCIYVSGYHGINVIDTRTLKVTELLPGVIPRGILSLSADASTLLCMSETDFAPGAQEFRVDLHSLTALPPLTIPGNSSAVLEGLNDRAYAVAGNAVYQFDATTGELQHSFAEAAPLRPIARIAMSPDRRSLYVTRDGEDGELSAYDISTADPLLVKQLSGSFSSPTPSRDGRYLYYVKDNAGSFSLIRAPLPVLTPARSVITSPHYLGPTAEGLDGSIYQSVQLGGDQVGDPSGWYSLYNAALQHTVDIPLGNLQAGGSAYIPLEIAFDNAGNYFFALVQGSYGSEVWAFFTNVATLPLPNHPTKDLLNISTRGRVEAGENAMIGGFIVQGPTPKKVGIRGIGPSLPITGAMANPVVDLYDSSGKRLASNDNWISNRINILGSLLAPSSPRESALLVTLPPGAYTTVVRDVTSQPGLALVEVYDLEAKNSRLANISTRGKVGTGDNVLIGGFIIGGTDPTKIIIRAIGPSLGHKGIGFPLSDPTLELHDGTGKLIARNDDWRATQSSQIIATGIPPTDNRESAIVKTLGPGNYTAILRGKNGATGVALVEIYNLDSASSTN